MALLRRLQGSLLVNVMLVGLLAIMLFEMLLGQIAEMPAPLFRTIALPVTVAFCARIPRPRTCS